MIQQQFFIFILSSVGPVCFLNMQLALIFSALDIADNNNKNGLSILPFLTLLTNGSVWFIYALMMKEVPVLIPNACAIISGMTCVFTYNRFSVIKAPNYYYICSICLISMTILFAYLNLKLAAGIVGDILSILLMGSPLSTLSTVIEEKSTKSMPFYTSLSSWLNGLSWTFYSIIVAKDIMVCIPSSIGFLLATIQLFLYIIYGFDKEEILLRFCYIISFYIAYIFF
jgi:uncharacterized protein with PQ loop repeat